MAMQGTFGSGGEVVFNLKIDTTGAETEVNALLKNFKQLEQVALRYLAIARRIGLPEEIEAAINAISRLIVIIRQLHFTIGLLEGSLGPIGWLGWLTYISSAGLTALSATELAGSFA